MSVLACLCLSLLPSLAPPSFLSPPHPFETSALTHSHIVVWLAVWNRCLSLFFPPCLGFSILTYLLSTCCASWRVTKHFTGTRSGWLEAYFWTKKTLGCGFWIQDQRNLLLYALKYQQFFSMQWKTSALQSNMYTIFTVCCAVWSFSLQCNSILMDIISL